MNTNLYALFRQNFPENQNKPFIKLASGKVYTYSDLEKETAKIANFLVEQGIQQGERVAVQVEKSPHALFLYLACLRSGIIYLPLNPTYKESELEYFFNDAQPSLIVCRPESCTQISNLISLRKARIETLGIEKEGTLYEAIESCSTDFKTVTSKKDDIAVILYTSGTTGKPKGAMLSHHNLAANGNALYKYWEFTENDVLLHALPLFHVHGLFFSTHCVLLSGSTMYFLPKFEVTEVIKYLPKCTVMMGVPIYYTRLLNDTDFTKDKCKNIRLFTSGSAPLHENTFKDFESRIGQNLLERYGMTEAGIIASNPLHGERLVGTVGFPLPGTSIRVVNDEDKEIAQGEIGHIQIKGDSIFLGYWNMPEKTAQEFTQDGYFRTGDVGKFNERGYLAIVGRAKDMIITGGFNVYPKEIEICIDEIEGIQESAVIGIEHSDYGEAVTAIIVKQDNNLALTENVIIEQLKTKLANYKVPKKIFFVNELPRNAMGKVEKSVLREKYKNCYQHEAK